MTTKRACVLGFAALLSLAVVIDLLSQGRPLPLRFPLPLESGSVALFSGLPKVKIDCKADLEYTKLKAGLSLHLRHTRGADVDVGAK